MARPRRRVCFVTGTRAEYGLMGTALEAIGAHPKLMLQVVATGMHLDRRHGESVRGMEADAVVPWPGGSGRDAAVHAANTGRAMARLAETFERLGSEVVLVVGDRVEAFAAAAAGHLSHRVVAHVHGGDRAQGQIDDSLRHAITKLAHVHFAATRDSARRIRRLGEDPWRIHHVGSPGNDGIRRLASSWATVSGAIGNLVRRRYALLVMHPVEADEKAEQERAGRVLEAVEGVAFERIVVIYPNNDPGCAGIMRCWDERAVGERFVLRRNVPRELYLGLMREAAVLVGNSSSGIIEAGSFGTPVLDIGVRQRGRLRGMNVVHCEDDVAAVGRALRRLWAGGKAPRIRGGNPYGGEGAGRRMADILAKLETGVRLRGKLIAF